MKQGLLGLVVCVALVGPVLAEDTVTFKKVDVFVMDADGDEDDKNARLELDATARLLWLTDEKHGAEKHVFARIPYDAITAIVYERSAHRRYGAGTIVNPLLFFTKGKKHWLTIEFEDVPDYPVGYVYARLDKNNYRQILAALRAGVGIEIQELIED